jgi:hypothetical protein
MTIDEKEEEGRDSRTRKGKTTATSIMSMIMGEER